jgi:hypothetical protein
MNRGILGFLLTTGASVFAIFTWPEIFLFSKVVYPPAWAILLPHPLMAPQFLALLSLVPAMAVPQTVGKSAAALAKSVVAAPLAAALIYMQEYGEGDNGLWLNAAFNYVWVLFFYFLSPAALLLLFRALFDFARAQRGG